MIKGSSSNGGSGSSCKTTPTSPTTYGMDFGRQSSSSHSKQLNALLVKYPVGKPKPTSYPLPPDQHVYGRPIDRKPDETTAKVLSNWQTKQKSKNAELALDYVAMNKMCVQERIVDPKGQYQHRKSHPIRVKLVDHSSPPAHRPQRRLPSDSNPQFAYGLPTRPSSPVAKLMSDHYEREFQARLHAKEDEQSRAALAKRSRPRTIKDQIVPLQKPKPKHLTIYERNVDSLFKMPRFRDVGARVDCHRYEGEGNGPWRVDSADVGGDVGMGEL
ncbi:hypothetical protein BC828DRAFT_8279 [Blastocladiella britannica]|nr:hypothetical protein BC828DRAFT_8279 [Blastocladiella britannica]